MGCADEAELEAFVAGELDESARARVEAKLDACAHCRQRLGALAKQVDALASSSDALFEPARDPYVGTTLIGRYRILRCLGSGGMGTVYEAEHLLIHRRVAIKLLHPHLATRREVLQRFRNEARAAGSIGHPGIVRAIDVGRTEDGAPFLVLELLAGRDLEVELAAEGPMAISRAVDMAVEMADALVAAHAAGIVHRDLKPANIFLATDGSVKVLDFGISKVRGDLQSGPDTRSGMMLGTPAYMAPEQLQDAASADARSDVYALAAIVFRCITGKLPRSGGSFSEMILSAVADPPPSARASRPEVPEALDALLMRALHPEPTSRPSTMVEMRDALRALSPTTRQATIRPVGDVERRAVLVIAAHEPRDWERVQALLDEAGGVHVPGVALGDPGLFVGVLGEASWSGDSIDRACALAIALGEHASRTWVGPGTLAAGELEVTEDVEVLFARSASGGAYLAPSLAHSRFSSVSWEMRDGLLVLSRSAPKGGLLPLVGRRGECAQLEEVLDAAMEEESAQLVFVEGPTGAGKSRLLGFLEELAGKRWRVLSASCPPRTSDYALIRECLREDTTVSLRIPDAPGGARLSADRFRVAALAQLEAATKSGPLLLLVDDARWADAASLGLLREFVRRTRSPLVLAAASRSPLEAAAWGAQEPVRISPRPLRRHETRALLANVLDAARAGELAEQVHRATGGNPLFIEQVGLALREGVQDGSLPLPPSIEGMMQARLDELEVAAREILKRGTVLGVPFTIEDLRALGVEIELQSELLDLVVKGLLRVDPKSQRHYALDSPLLAEAAYRMLGESALEELHRRAAIVLEGRVSDEVLAGHLEKGGQSEAAASAYARGCERARTLGDAGGVLRCGRKALALGLSDPRRTQRAIAEAHELRGELREQEEMLRGLETRCEGVERAAIETERAVALQRMGRSAEALTLLESAVVRATEAGDVDVLTRALGKHAVALTYAGQTERAAEVLRHAERSMLRASPALRAEAAVWRGQLASVTGELGEARNAFLAAVELYDELGDPRRSAEASVNLADFYNRVGAYDEAVPALRSALDACRRVGASRLMEGYACANLGNAHLGEGSLEAAEQVLDEAEAIANEVGESRLGLVTRVYRSKVRLARGDWEGAQRLAEDSAEEASTLGFDSIEALARLAAGRAALALEDYDAALSAAERADALRAELGGLEEDGGALFLLLAQALEAHGKGEEGARARALGRATIEATATRIGDRHWRERFLADVEAHRVLMGVPE